MLLKLAFSKNAYGLLRVNASAALSGEPIIAIFESDEVFLRILGHVRLSPEIEERIRQAASDAFARSGTSICCEEVELDDGQLMLLRLGEARRFREGSGLYLTERRG
jgi:hypothetical protein